MNPIDLYITRENTLKDKCGKENNVPKRVTLKTGVENNFIESTTTYSFLKLM